MQSGWFIKYYHFQWGADHECVTRSSERSRSCMFSGLDQLVILEHNECPDSNVTSDNLALSNYEL